MQNQTLEDKLIQIVRDDVVPALGCTEPISLALACAIAKQHLGRNPERIMAKVSPNLMKNGLGVAVPGTGMVGLPIAAAIGAIGGNPQAGLEVLANITTEQIAQAKAMLSASLVEVGIFETEHILYSEATLYAGHDQVRVCIQDHHTHVILIEKNGKTIYCDPTPKNCTADNQYQIFTHCKAQTIYDVALSAPLEKITFILQAAKLNTALSDEGLRENYGLHIGRTLQKHVGSGLMSDDLLSRIIIRTTAASDARMGGASLPAMSNSGSGNQGIAATMPVVVVAQYLDIDDEKLTRALFLSHLMAIFIHSKLPKLSALCAVTTASMGSCAGIAWLLTGKFETVSMSICSMIGDISGIICDGAANSCAMKVSTSVSSGYKAVLMAMDNTHVTGNEGIVEFDIDASINNLCAIASRSMLHTDKQVIEIMSNKPKNR
ncbi:L-cysteine desulfidase family protein [Spirabiliibacterium falconis]|uniref:L-cysteine desulfidase family protein n=1 Tax=Spirabiliibacterium falconis TaxID=572023 RepID=UPI001AAD9C38|nr:L-serine ammonia-lyase, iron-sulfur-dependent, subunit alpha [Spirabiliibacterium falconis]MBE2894033.1 serine dehydratase subunit alpha family protein [Spirabiliibacterium falconis]